jgi:hypothetical protein
MLPPKLINDVSTMIRLQSLAVASCLWLSWLCARGLADIPFAQPVIQTGVAAATQDKPQCKVWYAHERWWAWLPSRDGSAVYVRGPSGWVRLHHLDHHLSGMPGQADVWPDADTPRAVLVGNDRLATAELVYDPIERTYHPGRQRHEFRMTTTVHRDKSDRLDESLETATICRDGSGRWWIAYDRGRSIHVLWTKDSEGVSWSEPSTLAGDLMPDDICSLYALSDRIGVIWSDQRQESVVAREHLSSSDPERWTAPVYVQQGLANADDHLHCAVDHRGVLFVASKNSVDQIGKEQHVLRVRRNDGVWENHNYAKLTTTISPTRPIAVTGGDPEQLWLLHTVGVRESSGSSSKIVGIRMPVERLALGDTYTDLIIAERPVNNVTCPRHAFPENAPWIVLASDSEGHVYEADLRGDTLPSCR